MPFDNLPKDTIMPHPFKEHWNRRNLAYVLACIAVVCYTAVFSVVTQSSFPQTAAVYSGEERCVTTLKTAV